ncbi:Fur-regulated basic protein FbpA [Niallia sp. XMNu-256]|uniref:Fur-regulated basic protein FbpA n=1 Tax=Niallia sp. XMNu-256 TaxID=3082444 RepID=UPI0030D3CB79
MRNSMEQRRQKLINKLVALNVYKEEDARLIQSSFSKLQYEYQQFKAQYHPHGEVGSIHWT